ncbi:hypothetical protein [Streptomyces longwoodensis]|uniref:hypothetical protein n=1 Tax=Streptomyces longwoodensis TaxID=68231 RepID=UPI0036F0533A
MGATAFGVVLGIGALGAAAGALAAPSLAARYGPGPMMLAALAITPLTQIPLLLASPGLGWQFAIGGALFLQLACAAAAGTTQRTISWGTSVLSHHSSLGPVKGVRVALC